MAYNGMLEAFLASVCAPADLCAQSRMIAAASAALIATALASVRVFGAGDAALVWANTPSMALCALYAWRFARRFCNARAAPHRQRETERTLGLAALRPPLGVLVVWWVSFPFPIVLAPCERDRLLTTMLTLMRRRFSRTIAILRRSRE
ncbi:hypothetical protein EDB89DRAFT_2073909 [Lactarius sanguifluus]|nr:hypothetical protein EDB89DRAFT_2073909 [Lactarius sanguifluus]